MNANAIKVQFPLNFVVMGDVLMYYDAEKCQTITTIIIYNCNIREAN